MTYLFYLFGLFFTVFFWGGEEDVLSLSFVGKELNKSRLVGGCPILGCAQVKTNHANPSRFFPLLHRSLISRGIYRPPCKRVRI